MLLMGLRLAEGIDVARYRASPAARSTPRRSPTSSPTAWSSAPARGRVRATRAGFFVLDAVVADLAA